MNPRRTLLATLTGPALLLAWTEAHTAVLNVLTLVGVVVLVVIVVYAVRRQRTVDDDHDATVRRALARHSTSARYIYARSAAGQLVYTWDCVDDGFPLAWRTGYLKGRRVDEMTPEGQAGDEARAVYLSTIDLRTAGCYTRTEVTPDGRTVTVRYTHVPLPDGSGACEAVPLSPEIDAAVSERNALSAENDRLRTQLVDATERLAQRWRQMRAERAHRGLIGALTGSEPAGSEPAGSEPTGGEPTGGEPATHIREPEPHPDAA